MSDAPQIRSEVEGRVVKITVDNVRKKNAFVPEMMLGLSEALSALDRDEELWVAVLCAAGEHTTAGLDMPKFFGPTATRLPMPEDGIDPFALKRRTLKRAALSYIEAGEAAAIAAIPTIQASVMGTEDAGEGIRSFVERREARFQGR